jgi:hypothetical protein
MEDLLGLTSPAPLSLATLAFNLLLSILLSGTLAWIYTRYGTSLSNRARFSQSLPLLAMTTVLVISVVKSSLALSLGLVGALSIVRFRTAIKEPEELLYLFMSMVIGVGLGADQRGPTVVAVSIIVAFLLVRTLALPRKANNNLYLNVVTPNTDRVALQIRDILLKHTSGADLRRIDSSATNLQATYLVSFSNDEALFSLMDALRAQLPECEVSFVEQDNSLGA